MQTLKERLKNELKPLYKDLLEHTADYCKDKTICPFIMQWGKDYPTDSNDGILFVGRATNGWITDDSDVENLFEGEKRIFDLPNQMVWVKEKEGDAHWNSNNSAFWRVVRGVARNFYPDDELNHIAWSNLCKLAPDGGNPSKTLYNLQLIDASKILSREVEILSPKFVVMLTNLDWADGFISGLNNDTEPVPNQIIEKKNWLNFTATVYEIGGRHVILSEHPQGKGEQEHIECLTSLINQFK